MEDVESVQQAVPYLSYENGPAAMDWLVHSFGFVEVTRLIGEDGTLSHGEVDVGGGIVMLATPSPDYESPRRHRERCDAAAAWSRVPYIVDGVVVFVDDVDSHYQRALASGARMLSEPEDGLPGRRYRAEDLEGHRWYFIQRV